MATDLSSKYDLKVPRYTSYPTAPHFTAEVDSDAYRRWLGELDPGQALSLYTHIPFCDSMCWFCGCYTKVVNRYQPVRAYLDVLEREIDLLAAALPARFTVRHLHWGGGSPTILTGSDWLALVGLLRQRFDITGDAEIAVEIDPRDATEDYIAALAEAGVNRASIGVQDFDADVQAAINRVQPFAVVERVCQWLRRYGIGQLNLDLMYGLPRQTVARVLATVDQSLRLEPARLALFGYAHVPWMKPHQKMIAEDELPDAPERLAQLTAAAERLMASGFRPVGLDHFARADDPLAAALDAGQLKRNFQGYTTDDAPVLLGLGASAIGSLPQGYVQNVQSLADYREAIGAGRLATARGIALSADDRLRREVIERLMCELAVDLGDIAARHGIDTGVFRDAMDRLKPLAEDGICCIQGDRVTVPEEGRAFVRLVAAGFDAYLQRGQQRHSRAV
jgi:oxygen-independent coproporphyrinogen-3 oxidase